MQIIETDIPEVLIIEPKLFGDQRGFFPEIFQVARYAEPASSGRLCRTICRAQVMACLRGLHLQNPSSTR